MYSDHHHTTEFSTIFFPDVQHRPVSNGSSDDVEIELTFDMTKTKIVESPRLTVTQNDAKASHDGDTLEDTYASLGVTFLQLTSQMQDVMNEVTSHSDAKHDLPFIDDGAEAELDAAIEAAAPALDHRDHVTSIQVQPFNES